jgi:hypothetical protein
MAKIKVVGLLDLIDGPEAEALEIDKLISGGADRDTHVAFGVWSGKLREIRYILKDLDVLPNNKTDDYIAEYECDKERLLQLSPMERAKRTAWGHFGLFYWAVFNRAAGIFSRPQIEAVAAEFFTNNPNWTVPSLKLWYEHLNISTDALLDKNAIRILMSVEATQLEEARIKGRQATIIGS